MSITDISGIYNRAAVSRLSWPIAWSGAPDREYEGALSDLVAAARAALDDPEATAVEIVRGDIVAVEVS